ncbi:MAG: dockerin type I repeat-containing protein, partial [bacterium]
LGSFTGRLNWEPTNLRFVRHAGLPAGFIGFVNTTRAANGEIAFNGANAEGGGSNMEILKLDFLVIGAVGQTGAANVVYDAMTAARTFTNLRPLLAIENCPYTVTAGGLLGDVNGDGLVNPTDANIILAFDVGFTVLPAFLARINAGVGDVNRDGLTNSTDSLLISAFFRGQPVPFPIGKRSCP